MRGRSSGKAEEAEPKKVVEMNEQVLFFEVFAICCLMCFAVFLVAMP